MGEVPAESVDDNDIEECFNKAADYVELHASDGQLGRQDDMLKLYGLFKQATQGPCTVL
jgi:acyl-CoA-binding protein